MKVIKYCGICGNEIEIDCLSVSCKRNRGIDCGVKRKKDRP